ncbi:hypothetical protein Pfo_012078 [Paulownia fortunei]|nr:hypothetical protein Pfo_012078 [Paulownia fortunei]
MAAATSVSSRMSTNEIEIFTYSHERMVKELTRFIITVGLSLNLGEKPTFVDFVTKALNPDYTEVKQRTVIREAKKEFVNLKKELHSTFASLSHRVALVCDVWRNANGLNFVRVTAHWIDSDWSMQRRIINFKMLDFPIHAASISNPVIKSVDAWGIKDKIFSVTVDDVCDYADAMEDIKNVIHPILDGKLFRVRCVCRVLNSCILDGLELVSGHITKIRNGISNPYYYLESYISLCEKYGLKPKYGMFDHGVSWDSTREMLKRCMPYKDVLNEFIALHWPDEESDEITERDWEIASVYIRFLDVFYEAVDYISGNYYPSSSGILLHFVNIAKLFSEYRGRVMFEEKISVMEEKFLKHYERIPDLFCLAAVMDLRIKLSGCECLLESFYQCTGNMKVNVEEENRELTNLLHEVYNLYASQSSKMQQPSSSEPSASFSTSGFAWSLISQKKQKTADSAVNELTFYLQAFEHEMKDFDILEWWKTHEVIYPVLATVARDLLTTPVSTLAPDCAFIINPEKKIMGKSYCLRGRILEIYTCLRDWFNAELRTQGEREPSDDEESCCEFEDQAITAPEELEGPRTHFPLFSH